MLVSPIKPRLGGVFSLLFPPLFSRKPPYFVSLCLLALLLLSACQPLVFRAKKKGPLYPYISRFERPKEQKKLEALFQQSRSLIQRLPMKNRQEITFRELKSLLKKTAYRERKYIKALRPALAWVTYLEHRANRLKNLYQLPYHWQAAPRPTKTSYLAYDHALATPFQVSAFRHCKVFFHQATGKDLELNSGFRSPAYQIYLTAFMRGSLKRVFTHAAPPFYSRHQKPEPDLSISLKGAVRNKRAEKKLLKSLPHHCREFGFKSRFPKNPALRFEFHLSTEERYYRPLAKSAKIPSKLWKLFAQGMERSQFYPSQQGAKVILAMAAKESSWKWNPALPRGKKRVLKTRFKEALSLTEQGITGKLTRLFLTPEQAKKKAELKARFARISNEKNIHIHEWDFYQWTQAVHRFLQELAKDHQNFTQLGEVAFDVQAKIDRFYKEPQTFGLWQINVNHLAEKLKGKYGQKRYPELFRHQRLNRHELVKALSGLPEAALNREKTMGLLLKEVIGPHYWDHQQGKKQDLAFFASENLSGPLSTYRAALQAEIALKSGKTLTLDGDLAYFFPYSTKTDFSRLSQTQRTFILYLRKQRKIYSQTQKKAFKKLAQATHAPELLHSPLYQKLMGKKAGKRIFAQIKSGLYQQSPKSYARKVLALANSY